MLAGDFYIPRGGSLSSFPFQSFPVSDPARNPVRETASIVHTFRPEIVRYSDRNRCYFFH